MAEALVLDHNLSIMAVDRATGAPLAVALNGVMMAGEADMSREEVRHRTAIRIPHSSVFMVHRS